ncbi:MAG: NUDIX hydrolase [Clostridia bacterium]|nr:NUDIX hydrolase [Clostridia bacterium]
MRKIQLVEKTLTCYNKRENTKARWARVTLERQLETYVPVNEQEAREREMMLRFLREGRTPFERANETAHFTASAWVTNAARDRVLMIWHNIYKSWAWTGGHADGETDLLAVARREAEEETGVGGLRPVMESPVSLEIITVSGHEKRGRYVPSHLHYNVTYLFEADDTAPLRVKPDENSGVRWFSPEEALAACAEPWMAERVYKKLLAKMK